jgi:hypothetical protein
MAEVVTIGLDIAKSELWLDPAIRCVAIAHRCICWGTRDRRVNALLALEPPTLASYW